MAAFVGLTARALVVTLRCVAACSTALRDAAGARSSCEPLDPSFTSPPPSPKIFASVKNV